MEKETTTLRERRRFFLPPHGWIGLILITISWPANWLLPGHRTLWGFFPLWLGFALLMDGLTYARSGSSLLARSRKRYAALFFISAPGWWIFEAVNHRIQNWHYLGVEHLSFWQYFVMASISFSTVMPAVFSASQWIASLGIFSAARPGPLVRPDRKTTLSFFLAGMAMLTLLLLWPLYFFPFTWLALYFILEPLNIWLGHRSLADFTGRRDWRPILNLFAGVLVTAFFWEMWNFFAYPKWIYSVPWVDFGRIFEMPVLGYGGYLPFALELSALYHLAAGLAGNKRGDYLTAAIQNR